MNELQLVQKVLTCAKEKKNCMGHDRCTCSSPKERSKDVDSRLSAIERRLLEIEKIVYRKELGS